MSRVIGIDPGITATGYGLIEGTQVLDTGVIRPSARLSLPEKLYYIFINLKEILDRWRPDAAVIEEVIYHRNVRSALSLGAARGVVLVALRMADVDIHEISPTAVKLAVTGNGRASKEQVAFMIGNLLNFDVNGVSDHVTDALACAMALNRGVVRA